MATSFSWRCEPGTCWLYVLVSCIIRIFCGCKVKDNDFENESYRDYNIDMDPEKGMTGFQYPLQYYESTQEFQVVDETHVTSLVKSIVSSKEPSINNELRRELRRKINKHIKKRKHKWKKSVKAKKREAFLRKVSLKKTTVCTKNYKWETPAPSRTLRHLLVERSLAPPIGISTVPSAEWERHYNVCSHMRQNPPFSWTPSRRSTLGDLLVSRSLAPPIGISTVSRTQSETHSIITSNIEEFPYYMCTN